jgi:hypothetical protein
MKRKLTVLVLGLAFCVQAAHAHHSLAGIYDSSRQVSIEGVVSEFHFVNPHPFVVIAVKDQQWRLEMDNRYELSEVGMTAETLKPGDRVVASGSPARSQARSLYIRKLDRPADGFRYEQVGSSPKVRLPGFKD